MKRGSLKTIGWLTILNLAAVVLGVAYTILQVRYFGTERIVEVYFAAQSVVYLIRSFTQSGQLAEVFLPIYIGLKNTMGAVVAHQSYSVIVNRLTLYLVVLLGVGYWVAPWLMALFIPGFGAQDQEQATQIFRAFLPLIYLQVQMSFLRTILNAENVFGKVEVAGLINALVSIILLVTCYEYLGIWTLVLSLYSGTCVALLFYFYYSRSINLRYYLIFRLDDFDHSGFFKVLFSTFSYAGTTQLYNWALTASVSYLPQGTYAIFQYVQKLVTKVSSLIIQPVSIVFFTKVSSLVAKNRIEEAIPIINKTQIVGFFLSGAVALLSFAAGQQVLAVLWAGNKFGEQDLSLAYALLVLFFFLFLAQIFFAINRKITVSMGKARLFYQLASIGMFCSAIVMYSSVTYLSTNGLFLGLFFSKSFFYVIPAIILYRSHRELLYQVGWVSMVKYILIIGITFSCVYYVKSSSMFLFDFDDTRWKQALQGFGLAVITLSVYVSAIAVFYWHNFVSLVLKLKKTYA